MNGQSNRQTDEGDGQLELPGFRKISEIVAGVLAHLAGRPGDEIADRQKQAHPAEQDHIAREVNLTPRERDVLRLLARDGGSNKAIARELNVAPATVKTLLKTALRELRLHNRTAAALWYRERQDVGHLAALQAMKHQRDDAHAEREAAREGAGENFQLGSRGERIGRRENAQGKLKQGERHLSPRHVREDERRVPAGISGEGRQNERA